MKVAVIGAGKMGCALAQGLICGGLAKPGDITGVARSDASRAQFLKIDAGLKWNPDPASAVAGAGVVLLGVKPFQMTDILKALVPASHETLFISVAAGVTLANMLAVLGSETRLVRAMPNTPVTVGEGATAYAAAGGTTQDDKKWVQKMFSSLGRAFEVKEEELDAVTALSGSGPAYFYLFLDALEKAAIQEGLRPELAREMSAQTALGAATMLLRGKGSPGDLIAQVKSKGGTTEAALHVFAERHLKEIVAEAVTAAAARSRELSQK